MKYFKKESEFSLGAKLIEPEPEPFKTYEQTVESLPTYALKKRLNNLQASAKAYQKGTMPENVTREFNSKVGPILSELKSRGELK